MKHINPLISSRLKSGHTEVKPVAFYVDGIVKSKDYYVLSESITLLESEQPEHKDVSLMTLLSCYQNRSASFRLGITGSPGVGKSTFIDSIASHFTQHEHTVGILTVDPSSTDGKGSILGDKTRMEELAKDKRIFIRPSPSNRHLGGLNQYTFEAMILCEAAGIDRLMIETVGVGQSEVDVSNQVDATILLVLPGSGDSLQGIKKGVLEKADLVIIHKSDGDAIKLAFDSAQEFKEAIHLRKKGESVPVINYSSITEEGKDEVTQAIEALIKTKKIALTANRKKQEDLWLQSKINSHITSEITKKLSSSQLKNEIFKSHKESDISPFDVLSFVKDKLDISVKVKS